jgi:transposase-like protein
MNRQTIIRYSESFKLSVVKEYETSGLTKNEIKRKYGIRGGATLNTWLSKYGTPSLQNKIIRVESKDEKNRLKSLEAENKKLKQILAEQTVKTITQESILEILAEEQGLTVEELKKKFGEK